MTETVRFVIDEPLSSFQVEETQRLAEKAASEAVLTHGEPQSYIASDMAILGGVMYPAGTEFRYNPHVGQFEAFPPPTTA